MPVERIKNKNYLILLLGSIFALSAIFSFYYHIRPTTDAKAYNKIAWNIAQGYGYLEEKQNASAPELDDAIVRVGPGYEFFLAGIYTVFGHQLGAVWMLQALLRVATAYILFRTALLLFEHNPARESIAFLTVIFFGFMPDLIILNGMLLAETLFVFTLVLALYVSLIALRSEKPYSFSASLWWGVASLVRPTALAVAIAYAAGAYLIKKNIQTVLVVFLFPLLLLGAWSVRNSIVYDAPLFTTTAGAYALWVGNNPGASGGFDKTPEIQAVRDQYHSVPLSKISTQKYVDFLVHDPVRFVALQVKKTSMYFSLVRPSGFWFYLLDRPVERLLTLAASAVGTGFLFVFGGAGMYLYAVRREQHAWFLLSAALLQPLAVIPTYVETRYRVPLFPFLALFAAYAVQVLWQFRKTLKGAKHAGSPASPSLFRAFLFSGTLLFLLTLGDVMYSYDVIIERGGSLLQNVANIFYEST